MIPIFSILGAFLAVVQFILFIKLYISSRKTNLKSIRNFVKVFFFLSVFWGSFALPKLVINDLKLVQISLDLNIFFGIIAGAYFILVILELFYPLISPKLFLLAMTALGIVFLIFSILNLKPAFIHFQNNFVFYSENRNILINIIIGLLFSVVEMIAIIFLFLKGLRSREKNVRLRALLLGTAQIFIFSALIIKFVFGFLFNNIFIPTLASLILGGVFSTIFMLIAVFFVKSEESRLFCEKIYKEEK